jgi:hypothetical protein
LWTISLLYFWKNAKIPKKTAFSIFSNKQ